MLKNHKTITGLAVFGLLIGTTACGPKAIQIQTFPSTHRAAQALENETVDAVVGDYPVVAYTARESAGQAQVAGRQFEVEEIGIGVSKDAPELKALVTNALRKVMTERTYMDILLTWAVSQGKIDPPPAPADVPDKSAVPQLQDGNLKVGMELSYAPMEFYDEVFKREAGVDVELAKAIGRELGVEVVFVDMPFGPLIDAVEDGKVDILLSSMTITEERSKHIDFIPYLSLGSGVLVKKGNPGKIRSIRDMCGKRVAVQEGTSQVSILESYLCE